jgi:hypothetical protein
VIETAGLSAFRLDPATGVVTADAGALRYVFAVVRHLPRAVLRRIPL